MALSQQEYDERQRKSGIDVNDHKETQELPSEANKQEDTMADDKEQDQDQEKSTREELNELFGGLLGVSEVADMLGCKTSTVYTKLQNGDIPGHKFLGEWKIQEEDLLEWAREQVS